MVFPMTVTTVPSRFNVLVCNYTLLFEKYLWHQSCQSNLADWNKHPSGGDCMDQWESLIDFHFQFAVEFISGNRSVRKWLHSKKVA